MKTVKAVIFDMDGTLFDSENLSSEATNFGFTEVLGRELTPDENEQLIGRPIKKVLSEWFPEKGKEIYSAGRKYYFERMSRVRAYPGVVELLSSIHERKIRMALVTSSHRSDAKSYLSATGISEYFEFYVGQEDTQFQKPDPEPLLLALKRLKLEAADCIYIGDQPYDITAANEAGIRSVGAVWGSGRREMLEMYHPMAIMGKPEEVLTLLDSL